MLLGPDFSYGGATYCELLTGIRFVGRVSAPSYSSEVCGVGQPNYRLNSSLGVDLSRKGKNKVIALLHYMDTRMSFWYHPLSWHRALVSERATTTRKFRIRYGDIRACTFSTARIRNSSPGYWENRRDIDCLGDLFLHRAGLELTLRRAKILAAIN